jgi:hypothetical protein
VLSEDERVMCVGSVASPFNVSAEAATLSPFSGEQVQRCSSNTLT